MAAANQTKERSVHELFRGGVPEQKFNVNRACFPKEKHQNSQKWAKFMNFSFWPFLWFGLPGRLLININFLVRLLLGRPGEYLVDKPRFSPYFTQWKPSLSQGQPSLSLGQSRGRRAAEEVYVLKVYVPFSLAIFASLVFFLLRNSLVFLSVFSLFSSVFKGSQGETNPWCF